MTLWSAILGTLVGFSLGLTGGGGAIFAVPLLVYGIQLPPRAAVGVSLLAVGCTALVGFMQRARRGLVEFPTGLIFAASGLVGAPLGGWLADQLPEAWLLASFAALMVVIAVRMARMPDPPLLLTSAAAELRRPSCSRDPEGKLRLTSPCAVVLGALGLATGLLSGLFGVGGGFIIVPALVALSGMDMQRAVGTSLLVITLISASGAASHLVAGRDLPLETALPFTVGSVGGLLLGSVLAQRIGGPALRRVFAVAIVLVAAFVLASALH